MAAHSNILAWKILWAEEPGGLSPSDWKQSDMAEQPSLPTQLNQKQERCKWFMLEQAPQMTLISGMV